MRSREHDILCDACAHCRMLGYDQFKAATVSYW